MIKGLIAPNLTPFNDDLSIAHDLNIAHAKHLLASGCKGIAPFGTTGEALSVGIDERIAALDELVTVGIPPGQIVFGTGLTNIADTARLTRYGVEMGCAGAMILPPFYYKGVSDDGLFAYFKGVIEAVDHPDLKVYLYHIPQNTGVGLSLELVRRLHESFPDSIIGIKDSSGDWWNTEKLLAIEGLAVYPGSEMRLVEAMSRGAAGCISATANINSRAIAEVIEACWGEDWGRASACHEAVKAVRLLLQDYAPIPAQKAVLAQATGDRRWHNIRPPLMPLTADKAASFIQTLTQEFGFAL